MANSSARMKACGRNYGSSIMTFPTSNTKCFIRHYKGFQMITEDVRRIQAGWVSWKKVSGVLCDRKLSARVKGKMYKSVVRPAMLYGMETVRVTDRWEKWKLQS